MNRIRRTRGRRLPADESEKATRERGAVLCRQPT
jgi:hypothetical protein